jgi:hypothetical protein
MRQIKELRDIDRDIIETDWNYRYVKILVGIVLIGIVIAIGFLWDNYFTSPDIFVAKIDVVQKISDKKPSGIKFAKIQDIQVGERAIGINPEITNSDREIFLPDPEPVTWRKLTLEMIKPDGKRLDITLLRPLNWIDDAKATIDATIYLDLPEMGTQGSAKVLNIEPCPPIKRGKGNVITGTFHHEAANTIDVHVDGLSKPIGTTDNHPFWSVTRNEFIEAGKLQPDEQLQLHNGQTAKVIQILPRPGPERVHNLEVMNEHVYRVSDWGVLVHNTYGRSGRLTPEQIGGANVTHFECRYEMQGGTLAVDIGTIRATPNVPNQNILSRTLATLHAVAKENNAQTIVIETYILNDDLLRQIQRSNRMTVSSPDGLKHYITIPVPE